ncbi:MAG: sensor histidine kinase [Candidatus Methylomirabilia bacterium]
MSEDSPGHKVHVDRFLSELLEVIPDMVLVLDDNRRTIAANRQALTTLGRTESLLIGRRPGEILGCASASETPGGCGAAVRCSLCGALQAILGSQRTGEPVSRETRILVGGSSVAALDLLITARPTTLQGLPLTICILRDISDQKRRAILETLFFHDILNAAGGILGLAGILADSDRCLPPEKERECRQGMVRLSRRLTEEICHQRDLLDAERGVFEPRMEQIHLPTALQEVRELYAGHPVARGRSLEAGEESAGTIRSDATIVRRVLGNLVKNALEATPEGGVVRTSCRDLGESVALDVHNPGVMPREVQLQVFQRSFSTKADRGRGIGTYSIKLFVERYLKGTVDFTSAEPEGTTFSITLPKEPAAG